jgi:uncharacterized protein YcbK (DUF882 family)
MKLTRNFNLNEFASKDGADMPPEVFKNVVLVAKNLQVLRDFVGQPIKVNSGYRSPAHNKSIGGASKSQHVKGKAADIVIKGHKPEVVAEIIIELIKDGKISQGGIGVYNTFTHYDIRGTAARWSNVK